jgi:uncharacterized protein with GYD domain
MAKFLIQVGYAAQGLKDLVSQNALGRTTALKRHIASLGGRVEALYWALGEDDAISIADLPDMESAAALGIAIRNSGLGHIKVRQLLTADEVDLALGKIVEDLAPAR